MKAQEGAKLIAEDILKEAEQKTAEILSEAKKQAQVILSEARSEAEKEEKRRLAEVKVQGQQIYEEVLAAGRLRARKELLQRKENLINEVFKEAEKKLKAYASTKKYESDLVRIAVEACKKLGSASVIIRANKKDLQLLKKHRAKIEKASKNHGQPVKLTFGKPIQSMGGVKVSTPDGKMEIDDTFEGKLKREFDALRVKIAKILFEGS